MAPRSRSAFTLTELLVVITIIGMLVALLMPALIGARGRARITQCTNYQKELGSAILQYEIAKQRLPGYANNVGGKKVSWIPVILPFLGRNDLWEGPTSAINGWRTGNPATTVITRLAQLVCPDDSPASSSTTPLSYVISVGLAVGNDASAGSQDDVFRNLYDFGAAVPPRVLPAPDKTISLSSIKSPARRPMLSDLTYPIGGTTANRQWADYSGSASPNSGYVIASQLGFQWSRTVGTLVTVPFLPVSSLPQNTMHRGIIIVTFCDGHTESLADNAVCTDYDYAPIQ